MPEFQLRDTGDLHRINRLFREQADGKVLRKALTKGLRGVLQPVAREVRASYRAAPSKGHAASTRARREQPPLRTLLAKATRVEIRTAGRLAGARVRVDGRKLPAGSRSLPRYWEGHKRPWRAPVFGSLDIWVVHQPRPNFDRITKRHEQAARQEVQRVVAAVAKSIQRGGR